LAKTVLRILLIQGPGNKPYSPRIQNIKLKDWPHFSKSTLSIGTDIFSAAIKTTVVRSV
jgi:hypothetical protein